MMQIISCILLIRALSQSIFDVLHTFTTDSVKFKFSTSVCFTIALNFLINAVRDIAYYPCCEIPFTLLSSQQLCYGNGVNHFFSK